MRLARVIMRGRTEIKNKKKGEFIWISIKRAGSYLEHRAFLT